MKENIFRIMKGKILILLILLISVNGMFAEELELKYSKLKEKNFNKVQELFRYYNLVDKSLKKSNSSHANKKDFLSSYFGKMDKTEKYRFAYLDWLISYEYPKFYKDFFLINSHNENFKRNYYNDGDLIKYKKSLYNIFAVKNQIDLFSIRSGLWNNLFNENEKFRLLYPINWQMWARIKVIDNEAIKFGHHIASPYIVLKCKILNSPIEKEIGEERNIAIVMFGQDNTFVNGKEYIVNYSYSFSRNKLEIYDKSDFLIDIYYKFTSQINRCYDIKDEKLVNKSLCKDYFNPLAELNITTEKDLFNEILNIVDILKENTWLQ